MLTSWTTRLLAIPITITVLITIYMPMLETGREFPSSTDFYKFYLSSTANAPPYWAAPDVTSADSACRLLITGQADTLLPPGESSVAERLCLNPNLNPPLFLALTRPLASLEFATAWWLWSLTSLLAGVLALGAMVRHGLLPRVIDPPTTLLVSTLALLLYFPTIASFQLGQTTLLLLLPLTLGWIRLRRGRDISAGIWFGIAASFKPFICLLLIALLFARNWRALLAMGATGLTGLVLGALLLGPAIYVDYFNALAGVYWHAASWNASFNGFFQRPFGGSVNTPWLDLPLLASALTTLATLTVLAAMAYLLTPGNGLSRLNRHEQADVLVAITLPAMLLLSPLGWMYYLPLLVPTLCVIWRFTGTSPQARAWRLMLLIPVLLTALPSILIHAVNMNDPRGWLLDAGKDTYGLLILLGLALRSAQLRIQGVKAGDQRLASPEPADHPYLLKP